MSRALKLRWGLAPFLLFFSVACLKQPDPPYLDPPRVLLDPNGKTPLSARLEFRTDRKCRASIEVDGEPPVGYELEDLEEEHSVPVLGLYPDSVNEVLLSLQDEDGELFHKDTFKIRTKPLPSYFPNIRIDSIDSSRVTTEFVLIDLAFGNDGTFHSMPYFFDLKGRVRWYMDLKGKEALTVPLRRMDNGHFLAGPGGKESLYELDLLGKKHGEWDLAPYEVHHEVRELPNQHILMAVTKKGTKIHIGGDTLTSVNDHIIEFDRDEESIVREWDLREVLDVDRMVQSSQDSGDWIHVNAVVQDSSDGGLIVSAKNQGIFKVSRENELQWIMAPHKGWGRAGKKGTRGDTKKHLLEAVNENGEPYKELVQKGEERSRDFDWPWGQHAPFLMENGDIMLFDNGFHRHFQKGGERYSRCVQYRVDGSEGTVRQIRQFGREKGESFFSPIVSDVDTIKDQKKLFTTSGTIRNEGHYARFYELSYPDFEELFQASVSFEDARGSGKFKWGQFDLIYRAEQLPLLPQSAPLH